MPPECPLKAVTPESVLEWVARVTEQRSEEQLARCTVETLARIGAFTAVRILNAAESGDRRYIRVIAATDGDPGDYLPVEGDALVAASWAGLAEAEVFLPASRRHRRAIPILHRSGDVLGFLVAEADRTLAGCAPLLGRFAMVYRNYVDLLNDAECDTLTRLKNRKTFEENINRVIAASASLLAGRDVDERRRFPGPHDYHWLGILDIDRFKRVNDEFGHVFGDEVLLLFAGLMRRTFRTSDQLFRYGGEEFVVVLDPTTFEAAYGVFERFRRAVEGYDFPQVGQVTCSIGFIRILPEDSPAAVVGHADQALYYGKRNGRNRVCSYELLVQQCLIQPERLLGEVDLWIEST